MHFGVRMLQLCLRGVRSLCDSRQGGRHFGIRLLHLCLRGVRSLRDSRHDLEVVRVHSFGRLLWAWHVGTLWPCPGIDIAVLCILGCREKMCSPDYVLDGAMDIYIFVDTFASWNTYTHIYIYCCRHHRGLMKFELPHGRTKHFFVSVR